MRDAGSVRTPELMSIPEARRPHLDIHVYRAREAFRLVSSARA